MARLKLTEKTTDLNGNAITVYTGQGLGKLRFIGKYGDLVSNVFEVTDYLLYDMAVTEDYNDSIWSNVTNVERLREDDGTTIKQSSSSIGFCQCSVGENQVIEFELYCEDNTGNYISVRKNSTVYFQQPFSNTGLRTGEWLSIRITLTGNIIRFYVNDVKTYVNSLTGTDCNAFLFRLAEGNPFKYRNFRTYPIPFSLTHYSPITVYMDNPITQSGETPNLYAKCLNVLGEPVSGQSVEFIEEYESSIIFSSPNERTQEYNNGRNVSVISPVLSRNDLGDYWELSFKFKSTTECRVFIGSSEYAVPTNPQFCIFMGTEPAENRVNCGLRTTTTWARDSSTVATEYCDCRIVYENGTAIFYLNDTKLSSRSISFYEDYDDYVVGFLAWGSGTGYVTDIALNVFEKKSIRNVIGTGTSNSEGVAECTFTGTGSGKHNILAEASVGSRIISSEIYETIDGTFKDIGTSSDHNDSWTNVSSAIDRTRAESYTTLTRKADSSSFGYLSKTLGLTDFAIEFDIQFNQSPSASNVWIMSFRESSTTKQAIVYSTLAFSDTGWHHLKFEGNSQSIAYYLDGVKVSDLTPTGTIDRFQFECRDLGFELNYKNFVIYPI